MEPEKLTMTVEEVAVALHISRGLAYNAAREGKIPTIRIGRRLLISRRALEKLLEEPQRLIISPMLKDKDINKKFKT